MLDWTYVLGCRPLRSNSQDPSRFCILLHLLASYSFQILNTSQELKDTDLGYLEVR